MCTEGAKRLPEIEVLRGFAIAFTFLNHFFFGYMPVKFSRESANILNTVGFAFGVDIFFAISGFVIMRSLLQHYKIESPQEFWSEAWRFWKKRMWRIYPAAWFAVGLGMTLSLVFYKRGAGYFGGIDVVVQDSIAAIFHYFNFYGSRCGQAFACGPNQVYWSLSLEEQFYIALPFIMVLSGKNFHKALILLLVVQLVAPRPAGSILNDIRSDGFILGVLLALAHHKNLIQRFDPTFLRKPVLRVASIASLLLALALLDRLAANASFTHARSAVTLVAATLVYFASFDHGYVMGAGWCRTMWVWLGSRSYSIYLLHILAFGLVVEGRHALRNSGNSINLLMYENWVLLISAVFSTLIIAGLVNRFIEQPFIAHYKAKEI